MRRSHLLVHAKDEIGFGRHLQEIERHVLGDDEIDRRPAERDDHATVGAEASMNAGAGRRRGKGRSGPGATRARWLGVCASRKSPDRAPRRTARTGAWPRGRRSPWTRCSPGRSPTGSPTVHAVSGGFAVPSRPSVGSPARISQAGGCREHWPVAAWRLVVRPRP